MPHAPSSSLPYLRVRHLQLIETLVELGSLHKAAKTLHMSQPSASAMLREVERAFGTTLFQRTRQGVTLTSAGLVAVTRLKTILGELDMLSQELQSSPSLPRLRIGVLQHTFFGFLQRILPPVLSRINCQLDLVDGPAAVLVNHLEQNKVDCIIGRISAAWIQSVKMEEFFYQPLYETELCIACAPSHPLARARKLTLEDLGDVSWILPREGSHSRYVLLAALASAGLPPPRVQIEASSFLFSLPILSATSCLTIAPRDPVLNQQRLGLARILPIVIPPLLSRIAFAARRSSMMNPNIHVFWECVNEAMAVKPSAKSR